MNITLNLNEDDVSKAIAQFVKAAGHSIDDNAEYTFSMLDDDSLSVSITIGDASVTTSAKKRTRRSKAQIEADNAEAASATNAEDKGTPEPEKVNEEDTVIGNTLDSAKPVNSSGSLFAT